MPLTRLARALGALFVLSLLPFARARAQSDVIRGRVTSADGTVLPNVRVTATSIPGNVTREVRTNARGQYQMNFPGGTGDYIMGFASPGFTFRQFQVKRTADQDVLVADARLAAVQLDTVTVSASVQQRVSRGTSTPDVSGTERPVIAADLPADLQGNIAALAASLPGVTLIPGLDGAPDGFSVLGLGADQNNVTLNGVQFGANGLPRDASVSTSLVTSPYDVSRGGFSGANVNIRSGSGSNYRTRGMSLVLNAPQLMWTDAAARATGSEYTNVSIGGVLSGPIRLNKAFYNISYQVGRQSRPNQTLLSTSPLGFQTAGVASDSVNRFLGILDQRGVPRFGGPSRPNRLSDNGSVFGSFNITPPNSQSGASYGFNFNANWGQQSPVGGGVTSLLSSSGDRTNWGGGVQGSHSAYLGMLLSETNAGINVSRNYATPYLELPGGRVWVNSLLPNGASGVSTLSFGGSPGLFSNSRSVGGSVTNSLSWFDDGNKHRIKLATELQFNRTSQNQGSNLLGSFAFNSLADLEAGRPASFTRQLTAYARNSAQYTLGLSLGDTYRVTPDFQLQYGIRGESNLFSANPQFNAEIERVFGRRNDRIPTPIALSPRVGFSWTLGTSNEIAAFTGAAPIPRSVVRGGVAVFANAANSGGVGSVIDNTGLPSGVQLLNCAGDAAPVPDWALYAANPGAVPIQCADGSTGTVFANTSPNVFLFARDFRPQRSVRTDASWEGPTLGARLSTRIAATWSVNLNQSQNVDINFLPQTAFTLPSENDRPVFVQPGSIAAATGAIASRDARISPLFSRVTELRSDLRSQTGQITLGINPRFRTPTRYGWSLNYTLQLGRERASGFSSTAANPLVAEWTRASNGPHMFNYTLRYNFFNWVQASWSGVFRSGSRYTPLVAGDVNGDGYNNDRAFVPDAASADPALAAGMSQLLANTSGAARACLLRQTGSVAARNSCTGPWASSATLNFTLDRARFRMPQRTNLTFSISNPLGAADLVINGSGSLRGWGQTPFPDQSLLYLRGFDATTKRYKYEVNQRFGATRPQFVTLRSPVVLTLSMRYDLGATREQQGLSQQLASGRTLPGSKFEAGSLQQIGASSVMNPMTLILRQQDSLRLTAAQADSIASMNRRYAYRIDSIWAPVGRKLASLPVKFSASDAYSQYLHARHAQLDLLTSASNAIRELLTAEQRRKLPVSVVNALDPRYLESIRNGIGLYVGGGGAFSGFGGSMGGVSMMESGFTILR